MDKDLFASKLEKASKELSTAFDLYGPGPKAYSIWISIWSSLFDSDPFFKGAIEEFSNEIELLSLLAIGPNPEVKAKIQEHISAKSSGMTLYEYFKKVGPLVIVTKNAPFDKDVYDYFLAVKISLYPEKAIYNILSYHFKKYFQSDRPLFRNFLEYAILKEHKSQIDKERIKIIQEFCDDYLTREKRAPALSARKYAIILYINVQSKEHEELVPKVRRLKEYAKTLRIGVPSFVQIYYAVEKDFLKRKVSLIKEISSVHHLLKGASIEVADQIVSDLNDRSTRIE